MGQVATPEDSLPYRVEVQGADDVAARVIGRAASMVLAHAIFTAAQADFAGCRVVLYQDAEPVLESAEARS